MPTYRELFPEIRGPQARFYEEASRHRLMLLRCGACGAWVLYARVVCPGCGSAAELEWREASVRALAGAGLGKQAVGGRLATSPHQWMPSMTLGEYLGIAPRFTDTTTIGGASFVVQLEHALMAVESGRCEVALIAYGSNQRSHGGFSSVVTAILSSERPDR